MASKNVPLKYALVVFPQFEPLDAFGPTQGVHSLSRMQDLPNGKNLELAIVGPSLEPVSTGAVRDMEPFNLRVGQTIVPTHTFDNPPEGIDVMIVPGGYGTGPEEMSGFDPPGVDRVIQFIRDWYPKIQHLLTICTGSGLAARAGVLDGQKATTNKQCWSFQTPLGPKTHWVANARWVKSDNGKLWTCSGVSAGIDGFLAMVEHAYGKDANGVSFGDRVSDEIEYNRVRDSSDDPFAVKCKVKDVLPQA